MILEVYHLHHGFSVLHCLIGISFSFEPIVNFFKGCLQYLVWVTHVEREVSHPMIGVLSEIKSRFIPTQRVQEIANSLLIKRKLGLRMIFYFHLKVAKRVRKFITWAGGLESLSLCSRSLKLIHQALSGVPLRKTQDSSLNEAQLAPSGYFVKFQSTSY